jgi:hypothetical protein
MAINKRSLTFGSEGLIPLDTNGMLARMTLSQDVPFKPRRKVFQNDEAQRTANRGQTAAEIG